MSTTNAMPALPEPYRGVTANFETAVRIANYVARATGRRHRVRRVKTSSILTARSQSWEISEVEGVPSA